MPVQSHIRSFVVIVIGLFAIVHAKNSPLSGRNCTYQETRTSEQQSNTSEVRELALGMPIEEEIGGGRSHFYSIPLIARQYMHVIVQQKGIDVVLRLFGPNGQKLAEVDSPNGTQGPEPMSLIAEHSGIYRLEVTALDERAMAGKYEIRLEELRASTEKDRLRIEIERGLADAEQLRAQGTAESLRMAIEKYNRALPLLRTAGDQTKEAEVLIALGYSYQQLGEPKRALDYYHQALPLLRGVEDRLKEARALSQIGLAYRQLGEPKRALDYYNRSLSLRRAVADKVGEAATLHNIGVAHHAMGELQNALDYFNQAVPLWREVGDKSGEAGTLILIGAIYRAVGEDEKALDNLNLARKLARATENKLVEASTLNRVGEVYFQENQPNKALEYYNLALPLLDHSARAQEERGGTLSNICLAYWSIGQHLKALGFCNQALELVHAAGSDLVQADTLFRTSLIYESLGQPEKSLDYLSEALSQQRRIGNEYGEVFTHQRIARVERDRGNFNEARAQIEAALNIIENTRSKLTSRDLRTSYLAVKQSPFEFYIDLLMRMDRNQPSSKYASAALQASERARARGLLESLTETHADIRQGVDPVLLARERAMQELLNAKAEWVRLLLSGKHTPREENEARKELEGLINNYREIEAEVRIKSPRYAALMQPQSLSVKQIQEKVLDEDTILLEYSLGDERSYVFAMTPSSVVGYELPKRAEIDTAARHAYELIVNKSDSLSPNILANLSQMLLGPLADQLAGKRLLIVADGALQYLPFGALPDPAAWSGEFTKNNGNKQNYQPLILRHEIISLPSASVLALQRRELSQRPKAPKTLIVFADPVFSKNDERVIARTARVVKAVDNKVKDNEPKQAPDLQRSTDDLAIVDFQRLPLSRREAELISEPIKKNQSLKLLDFAADHDLAVGSELSKYQIVHFATHSLLNNEHPELSGVVLSLVDEQGRPQNGFLRLNEIYNLKLNADLVVLSSCQTALGKDIKGEGLVGLSRGFMYAGARRVVASLWKVSDTATADLMNRFYDNMLVRRMTPAAALRAAQISVSKQKQWEAPYYWAGFVLQGEWN